MRFQINIEYFDPNIYIFARNTQQSKSVASS